MDMTDEDRERLIRSFMHHGDKETPVEFFARLLDEERKKSRNAWQAGYEEGIAVDYRD